MADTPSPESLKAAEKLLATFDVGTRWTNFDDTEHGFTVAPVETVAFAIDAAYADLRERCESRDALLKRTLSIIVDAIMHGMPITEEVAAVRNEIVALSPTPKEPTHG